MDILFRVRPLLGAVVDHREEVLAHGACINLIVRGRPLLSTVVGIARRYWRVPGIWRLLPASTSSSKYLRIQR